IDRGGAESRDVDLPGGAGCHAPEPYHSRGSIVCGGAVASAVVEGHGAAVATEGALRLECRQPVIDEILNGKYRLVRQMGAGGMGAVYEAEEIPGGRRVA